MTDALEPDVVVDDEVDAAAELIPDAVAVRLYGTGTVAVMLEVSRRYVQQLIADGELRAVLLGKLVRVRDDDLARFVDERTAGAA